MGKIRQPIGDFLQSKTGKTDIFCLQEIGSEEDGFRQLAVAMLPGYTEVFAEKNLNQHNHFTQATYVHPNVQISKQEELFPRDMTTGLGVVTEVGKGSKKMVVCNFHGLSRPGDKLDTHDRLRQSARTIAFFRTLAIPLMIGGDFNLDYDAESVQMFERAGLRNLIKEHGVKTTRNRIAWEKFPATPQKHSDYVFVSQDIQVTDLQVPEVEISDHLPIILNVELP
jgi:endonuclease/exonuclease/phosphatase family metal-dependent hydrolase